MAGLGFPPVGKLPMDQDGRVRIPPIPNIKISKYQNIKISGLRLQAKSERNVMSKKQLFRFFSNVRTGPNYGRQGPKSFMGFGIFTWFAEKRLPQRSVSGQPGPQISKYQNIKISKYQNIRTPDSPCPSRGVKFGCVEGEIGQGRDPVDLLTDTDICTPWSLDGGVAWLISVWDPTEELSNDGHRNAPIDLIKPPFILLVQEWQW